MSLVNRALERCEIVLLESPFGQRMLGAYRRLPDYEQRLVWLAGSVSAVVVLVLSLAVPATHFAVDAMASYQRANRDYQWLVSRDAQAREATAARQAAAQRGDIRQLLGQTAQSYGMDIARVEGTSGQGAQVWLDGVPFDDLAAWVDSLGTLQYLQVVNLDLQRTKPGHVEARVGFSE